MLERKDQESCLVLQLWWQSFPSQLHGMAGSPEEAMGLGKRIVWRLSPIMDGDQDSAQEVVVVGQKILNTSETKIQKEGKQWTFYMNQWIGSFDNRTHIARLTG